MWEVIIDGGIVAEAPGYTAALYAARTVLTDRETAGLDELPAELYDHRGEWAGDVSRCPVTGNFKLTTTQGRIG